MRPVHSGANGGVALLQPTEYPESALRIWWFALIQPCEVGLRHTVRPKVLTNHLYDGRQHQFNMA